MSKLILCLAMVLTGFGVIAPAASASEPTQVQVAGFIPFANHTQTLLRTADGNLFFSAVDKVAYTGGVVGAPVDTYTFTVHPDGSITGQGIKTCTLCTIGGRTGGYTEVFNFTATPNFATFTGRFAVLSATGGLAGLQGEGTFVGGPTATGFAETVVLNYHSRPDRPRVVPHRPSRG
jgi:hypothetical protein